MESKSGRTEFGGDLFGSFIKNGYANIDPVKDEFLNGKAATLLGGSWNVQDLEKSDLNRGVSYYPVSNDGKAVFPPGTGPPLLQKTAKIRRRQRRS